MVRMRCFIGAWLSEGGSDLFQANAVPTSANPFVSSEVETPAPIARPSTSLGTTCCQAPLKDTKATASAFGFVSFVALRKLSSDCGFTQAGAIIAQRDVLGLRKIKRTLNEHAANVNPARANCRSSKAKVRDQKARRPALDAGLGFVCYLCAANHSSHRSRQSGLSASISANFHGRFHFLTSFSRAIAGAISSYRSA